MMLNLLTAIFVVAAGAGLLACLTLGLLSLSQYIEFHASKARRIGLRSLGVIVVVEGLVVFLDDVPLTPLLPALIAASLHYSALRDPFWPYSAASSSLGLCTSIASLVLLPLTSHIWLVRYHTLSQHAWQTHRYDTLHRHRLPGGRLDWDVASTEPPATREMTNLQVCAVLVVCVWSIPVYRLLGRVAAAEWGCSGGMVAGQSRMSGVQ
ncbi:uncharacterized protein UMAG_12133 [Mycosarcoma maydis]|uniref:Uncharacterized protein n=1 Tax=Mycosarcoma maydis TaxID=5270 RepID=A0A0D1CEE8_MYCMD|nr:uncharacterized protein UMAG_12133 [Ustilago maydis 521]KIS71437.1 hypothetical protein UMAG_12133 [Ustilago maydis 521]|eukprot:XP_011387500.1 hypothetical protein UMAG_12133 [Ustilago maydis 521]